MGATMKKTIAGLFLLTLIATAFSPLLAQRQRRDKDDYFFLPPRNLFFVKPGYYPPLRLYGPSRRHYRDYRRYGRYQHYNRPSYPSSRYGFDRGSNAGVYTLYLQSPASKEVIRSNTSDVVFQVDPPQAMIYINDKLIGSARDFSTNQERYPLVAGEHDLRIEFPGFVPFQAQMEIVPNKTLHLDIELEEKTP